MWSTLSSVFATGLIVFGILAWRAKKKKTGTMKKWVLYSIGCFILTAVFGQLAPPQKDTTAINDNSAPASSNIDTSSNTNSSTVADTAPTQKSSDAKQNQAYAQKAADDQVKKVKASADAKVTQQAELQTLGDWSIQSNSDDFSKRYTDIQNKIAAGDRQSAYDEATMASKRADDLNSKTMNNQDMDNVPKDIPSNVRDTLSGVDSLLATGYMSEKDGFDKLADAINTNDLAKLSAAKDDFAEANDQFNQAKALITKANDALK